MYLALDIGGTNIQFAILNNDDQILKHWEIKTPIVSSSNEFYDRLFEAIPAHSFKGIGIAVPGVVNDQGYITSKASPRLYPLYQSNIVKAFSHHFHCPTSALNDAKAAGLCELRKGAAMNCSSSVSYLIGTGVGGALSTADSILFGNDGYAGEFSYMPVQYQGKYYSLGMIGSANGLLYLYKQISHQPIGNAKEVFEKFYANDNHALQAVEDWLNITADSLWHITAIFNPEVILIGGGISEDDRIIDLIREKYQQKQKPYDAFTNFTTRIDRCMFKNKANLLGALIHHKQKNG
ncbi:ROK family protein [Erysipelothrix urinaevulpis]|uniref:ROK family protein n=1 Tax=Erysipelothrix urinaevulpis TaxID=2683717 RepID=UPI00135AAF4C|nr:ROK family protein [Erysipelothrix urinaevulpis]